MFEKKNLIKELKDISKGSYKGIPYSSFHHPKFTYLNTQRNTYERLKRFGINSDIMIGKDVLDHGSKRSLFMQVCKRNGESIHKGRSLRLV